MPDGFTDLHREIMPGKSYSTRIRPRREHAVYRARFATDSEIGEGEGEKVGLQRTFEQAPVLLRVMTPRLLALLTQM